MSLKNLSQKALTATQIFGRSKVCKCATIAFQACPHSFDWAYEDWAQQGVTREQGINRARLSN